MCGCPQACSVYAHAGLAATSVTVAASSTKPPSSVPLEAIAPVSSGAASGEFVLGLGPMHLFPMRLNAALMRAAIDEGGSWTEALEV